MTPTKDSEREFLRQCQEHGIETDINMRWETGMDHHPLSVLMMGRIAAADWLFNDDYFCWKTGGDGDNGEALMYLMDMHFELEDAVAEKAN
jgi:hypothetical protein